MILPGIKLPKFIQLSIKANQESTTRSFVQSEIFHSAY